MSLLLHVLASPRMGGESLSRRLAEEFLRRRRAERPDEYQITVDLYFEDIPYLDALTADKIIRSPGGGGPAAAPGAPTPSESPEDPPSWPLEASDRCASQFARAERILITTPLWNFGPPAVLKAWMDLVVRPGIVFEFGPEGPRPLAPGQRMLLIGARGGVYSGESPLRGCEHLETWLRALAPWLGVDWFEAVWAEGPSSPESAAARGSRAEARRRLEIFAREF